MTFIEKKRIAALVGCSLSIFLTGAFVFGYPGLMGPYWQEAFQVDAAATGNTLAFVLLALGIFMFFAGKWHERLGTRKSILIGAAILACAMLVLIFAKNIYMVYAWAFMNGVSNCFIYGPGLTTVQKWFPPHRKGLATGTLNCVFGIAAALMLPVFQFTLVSFGYVKMNIIMIVLIAITNIAASMLAEVPEKTFVPDKERQLFDDTFVRKSNPNDSTTDFTVAQALKTRQFWMIWLTWVFMGAAGISMISLSANYAVSLGLSSVAVLAAFNVTNGVSRIIAGSVSDVIGRNLTGCSAFVMASAGCVMLAFSHTLVPVSVAASLVGLGFGTLFAITAPLASDIFGLRHFGMIFGLIFTAYGFIGGLLGPAASGYVLRASGGNYFIVFGYLAVFCLLSAWLIMQAKAGMTCDKEKKAGNK